MAALHRPSEGLHVPGADLADRLSGAVDLADHVAHAGGHHHRIHVVGLGPAHGGILGLLGETQAANAQVGGHSVDHGAPRGVLPVVQLVWGVRVHNEDRQSARRDVERHLGGAVFGEVDGQRVAGLAEQRNTLVKPARRGADYLVFCSYGRPHEPVASRIIKGLAAV